MAHVETGIILPLTEHFLCSRLCDRGCVHIISFNAYNFTEVDSVVPVIEVRKLRFGKVKEFM